MLGQQQQQQRRTHPSAAAAPGAHSASHHLQQQLCQPLIRHRTITTHQCHAAAAAAPETLERAQPQQQTHSVPLPLVARQLQQQHHSKLVQQPPTASLHQADDDAHVQRQQQQQQQQQQRPRHTIPPPPLPPPLLPPQAQRDHQPLPQANQPTTPHRPPIFQVQNAHSIAAVCRLMQHHGRAMSAGQWVKAYARVLQLVADEGQAVPADGWQQLRRGLLYLTTPQQQQQQQEQQEQQAAPISAFTAWQVSTLLAAAAKLSMKLPADCWPTLLAHLVQVSSSMPPRVTANTVWALSRLDPPQPVAWEVQALLERSKQPLQAYSPRSLSILLRSLVRLQLELTPACKQQLLEAVAARLGPTSAKTLPRPDETSSSSSSGLPTTRLHRAQEQHFSGQDLCLLVWALPCLRITPPPRLLTAVLQASRRHLPSLSWEHLTALLVGVGRLRFVPPGPLVLDLYDQLYWTVDQLSLGQLCAVVWSLGRLRLVAVPPDMLERLLVFVGVRLQQEQQSLKQQQQQQHEKDNASKAAAPAALARQRFTLAKQLSLLLSGLRGLSRQLSPQQQQQCHAWLLAVLEVTTPQAAKQVAGSILAAASLKVRLALPDERTRLFDAVSAAAGRVGSTSILAQAVWGAVAVGGPPPQSQLQQWLQQALPAVATADAGTLHMLLHACVRAGQQPSEAWCAAAALRLQQLVPRMSGSNCVFLSQLLVDLVLLLTQQQQEEDAVPALSGSSVRQLFGLLCARVEQLEVQQQHISSSAMQNFERNRQQLLQLLA